MDGAVVVDRALGAHGWLGPSEVSFSAGVITAIRPAGGPGDGTLLVPGFIDLQVNGKGTFPVFTASEPEWRGLQRLVLAEGVTTWLPTLITEEREVLDDRIGVLRRRCAAAEPGLSDVAGIHLEGPFLGSVPGAHPARNIVEPNFGWIDSLPAEVRLMTVGAESADTTRLIQRLRSKGIVVGLGHTDPTPESFAAAIEAGATMITHLFNGMGGVDHRKASLAALAITTPGLAVSLIADGAHVNNAWLGVAVAAKGTGEVVLVTDSVALRSGITASEAISEDVTPLALLTDGTIAGSVLTMDAAIRRMVNDVGVPLEHAIAAASTNPARIMGLSDRGVIAVGNRADLVLLDRDLEIDRVLVAGCEAA